MNHRAFFPVLTFLFALLMPSAFARAQDADTVDTRLIHFFDELIATVRAQEGNCEPMTDALRDYCQAHRDWIHSLDYVTENASEQTVAAIREKAVELGKLLSSCYDGRSATVIPKILEYCANPS